MSLAIFAIELVLSAAARGFIGGADGIGWRIEAINDFAFFPELLKAGLEYENLVLIEPLRFLSYAFVHVSFTHAVFVIVFLLALGKLVGEVLGSIAVVATFVLASAFGALVFAGLTSTGEPLMGGFPAVYGLIGSYTFLLWVGYGAAGENQWRAFTLIGLLLGLQLIFAVLFGSNSDWIAEVGGFLFGFAIAPLARKGGLGRVIRKLRQR